MIWSVARGAIWFSTFHETIKVAPIGREQPGGVKPRVQRIDKAAGQLVQSVALRREHSAMASRLTGSRMVVPARIATALPNDRVIANIADVFSDPATLPDMANSAPATPRVRPQGPILPGSKAKLFSGYGYIFARSGGRESPVGLGNQLGGNQSAFQITGPALLGSDAWVLRPFGRVTGSLDRAKFDEAAIGLSFGRRFGAGFVDTRIERRIRANSMGGKVFAVSLAAGVSAPLAAAPVLVSAYGQAGVVGAVRRDAFADGEIRLEPKQVIEGIILRPSLVAWGAIQPGASRIDVGPSLTLPIANGPVNVSIRVDWRFRIAGNARPGSGPAITLSNDF